MAKRTIPPERRSAQAKFPYFRQIKVRTFYYDMPKCPKTDEYRGTLKILWINMKGQWLAKAGFTLETLLDVKIQKGRITLMIKTTDD